MIEEDMVRVQSELNVFKIKIFSLFQDVYAFSSYMYNRLQISIKHGYESALSKKVAINNHTIKYTKSFLTGNNFEEEEVVDTCLHPLPLDGSCK